jgi:hypothetical protein
MRNETMTHHSGPITEAQINEFVAAWYLALDQHVPTAEVATLVADREAQMIFPEKTLVNTDDVLAWYSGGTYSDGEKAPGVINIFFDENHNVVSVASKINGDQAQVRVVVAWQASSFVPPAAKSKRVSADFTQDWILQRSTKNPYGLVILSYNAVAEPPSFAPGFARL